MTARNVGTDIIVSPFTARSGTAHAALKVNGYRGPSTQIDAIQRHYDRLSAFYRTFWGEHIHHGLWEGARNAKEAQVALIERLAAKADIRPGSHVLDVGCGLGGSSIWLARNLKCTVVGLTISPVQLEIATRRARRQGLSGRVQFRLQDANDLSNENEFDCVWVVECSEHLFNKVGFISRAAAALHAGGVLALCAWLRADGPLGNSGRLLIDRVCRGMLCPSLGTKSEYCKWITAAGLSIRTADDITAAVSKTWHLGRKIVQKPIVQKILMTAESETVAFVNSFNDMAEAYSGGVMSYGMFAAVKERPRDE